MKRIFLILIVLSIAQIAVAQIQKLTGNNPIIADPIILFQEDFEDTLFESRGWYDHLSGTITTAEHIEGSTACFECKFLQGESGCEGGTPGRHLFDETDEVYLSYHVKYSSNYTGSNKPYHPHEFHFITTENGIYVGPAWTHLTTYIEQNEGEPLLAIQDGENIDESNIGVNLTGITEERAVAGCNGDSDGYGDGDCYSCGAVHCNGKQWRAGSIYFQDEPGQFYKNDWHFIEAYFKLNSIVEGIGIADGIVKYWYDGELIIDHEDIVIRTGEFPDMKFYQFLMAPYIGDGSPVEQVMWIDNMTVATSRVTTYGIDDPFIPNSNAKSVLSQNYPNPFSQSTVIGYQLQVSDNVVLEIYNLSGKGIRTLVNNNQSDGEHSVIWDGTNDSGKPVPAGVYFYKMKYGDTFSGYKKMILMK